MKSITIVVFFLHDQNIWNPCPNLTRAIHTPGIFSELSEASYSCYSHAAFLTQKSNIDGFHPRGAHGFLEWWIQGFIYNGVNYCRSSESTDACSKCHSRRSVWRGSAVLSSQVGKFDFRLVHKFRLMPPICEFINLIQSARLAGENVPGQQDKMLLLIAWDKGSIPIPHLPQTLVSSADM